MKEIKHYNGIKSSDLPFDMVVEHLAKNRLTIKTKKKISKNVKVNTFIQKAIMMIKIIIVLLLISYGMYFYQVGKIPENIGVLCYYIVQGDWIEKFGLPIIVSVCIVYFGFLSDLKEREKVFRTSNLNEIIFESSPTEFIREVVRICGDVSESSEATDDRYKVHCHLKGIEIASIDGEKVDYF